MTKTTENYSLPEALRNASPGRDEWRVQDPQTGAYCIAFSRGDGYTLDPEREAREWLAEQKARFPDSTKASYVVACVHVRTRAETLMQEAAAAHERLRAALAVIEGCQLPPTGRFWDEPANTRPMSYGACYGSNGERDFMRQVARDALGPELGADAGAELGPVARTALGFERLEFKDCYGTPCSLQASSLAKYEKPGTSAVWLGPDDVAPKVLASQARSLGVDAAECTGWVPYPIPPNVSLITRMHLDRAQVAALILHLQSWLDNDSFAAANAEAQARAKAKP